jgi:heme exporter protein B
MHKLTLIGQLLRREFLIYSRTPMTIINPLLFFVVIIALFIVAVDLTPVQLTRVAPALIWISALLAILLTIELPLKSDEDDGSLLQLMIAPTPFYAVVMIKIVAYWIISGLPLVLLTPVMGLLLNIPTDVVLTLMLTLLIGTPILCTLGVLMTSLVLRIQQAGLLLQILVSILQIPTLILATSTVDHWIDGFSITNEIMLLLALLILTLTLAPLATVGILKAIVE